MKIHLIGVGGIAMGTLACMLKEAGHSVTGSDENIYPPMSDILLDNRIETCQGYSASNLRNPELVIIGNAISRGNPEVEHVLDNRLPYLSMACALFEFFLRHREVINVSGTHGKTTTTSLISHVLVTAGEDPSFFIGGRLRNYGSSHRLGKGRFFVIEGDEYDSAFFEKVPKFIFYRPYHAVLTSLEFDHADIYNNLEEIELWFRRLVNIIPSGGILAYCSRYANLSEIASRSRSRVVSFGMENADYSVRQTGFGNAMTQLSLAGPGGYNFSLESRIHGEFNLLNIAAACSLLKELGISDAVIKEGVVSFEGVSRRQEVIYSGTNLLVYEDFAHHPTAISGVLDLLSAMHPDAEIWALYEPRSATSRRNVFQNSLADSFRKAHHALFKTPFRLEVIPEGQRLDIRGVERDIRSAGRDVHVFDRTDEIVHHLEVSIDRTRQNVVVIMSNGGFDGIYEKISKLADYTALNKTGIFSE